MQDFKNHYDFLIVGGGLMGSMIAHMLTSRVDTKTGVKVANDPDNMRTEELHHFGIPLPQIGIIEKDPSYRYSLSTSSPLGIRMQSCLPETIESSLFGTDFLRCYLQSHYSLTTIQNIRNLQHEMSVSADTDSEQEYLNQPNIKFQPHGHLTLAAEQDMEQLIKDHEMQKVSPWELHPNY